jgi:hypothetical protein
MMHGHRLEIHYGIVTDNVDKEQRGRLKVQCGTLAPTAGELPAWVEMLTPFLASSNAETSDGGWLFIPDIGVVVELRVLVGAPSDESEGFSSIIAPNVRWTSCMPARGSDTVPVLFQTNYPLRRGITTARGHILMWDDTKGSEELQLSIDHKNGTNSLKMDTDGMVIETGGSVLADCASFTVAQGLLATSVIVEGSSGFQATLASSLTELAALIAGLGLVATTTTGTVVPALVSGSFSSTLLFAE